MNEQQVLARIPLLTDQEKDKLIEAASRRMEARESIQWAAGDFMAIAEETLDLSEVAQTPEQDRDEILLWMALRNAYAATALQHIIRPEIYEYLVRPWREVIGTDLPRPTKWIPV